MNPQHSSIRSPHCARLARAHRLLASAAILLAGLFLARSASAAGIDGRIRQWIAQGAPAQGAPARSNAFGRPARPQLPAGADGRILCWVTCRSAAVDTASWRTRFGDCAVEGKLGAAVQVRIAAAQIAALAAAPEVEFVGLPPRPYPLLESQGLDSMRVREFWSLSGRGEGARIGVLDIGFQGYQQLLGSELPAQVVARSFYHNSSGNLDITGDGEPHGAACAEIVHDVAPSAEIYLANAGTPAELQQAEQWLVDQGVEVISHSVGWFWGAGDGTGDIDDIANAARSAGVLWVNAAGNFAEGSWNGTYQDQNNNSVLDLDAAGHEELTLDGSPANNTIEVVLLWDHWPTSSDLDFEMDLMQKGNPTPLATSQLGPPDPYALRTIDYNTQAGLDSIWVRVRLVSGTGIGSHLRIIRTDGNLAARYQMPDGSMVNPADSPEVLAAGAFDWDTERLEPYSSRGPTTDGRTKPDILGPDCVTTATYGRGSFCGTSSACPHVAGAAALILASAPHGGLFDSRWSIDDVLQLLERNAVPAAGDPDPQGVGWGRVRLPLGRPTAAGSNLLTLGYGTGSAIRLRLLRAPAAAGELRIYDVTGRLMGRLAPERVGAGVLEYQPQSIADRLRARGRYFAYEPVSRASTSFYWPGGKR